MYSLLVISLGSAVALLFSFYSLIFHLVNWTSSKDLNLIFSVFIQTVYYIKIKALCILRYT